MKIKRGWVVEALREIGLNYAPAFTDQTPTLTRTNVELANGDDALLFMAALTLRLREELPQELVWSAVIGVHLNVQREENLHVVTLDGLELED